MNYDDDPAIVPVNEKENIVQAGNIAEAQLVPAGPLQTQASLQAFDEYMAVVKHRAEKVMELREYLISKTTHLDWDNLDGKPYLNIAGANKAMKVGIINMDGLRGGKDWSEDEKRERYYYYKYIARFFIPNLGDSLWEMGRCSQRDLLFGTHKVPKLGKDGKPETYKDSGKVIMVRAFKPASEVDEGNIDKSAMTNLRVRGVRAISGLSSVTWEELERLAGITPDMIEGGTNYSDSAGGEDAVTKAEMRQLFNLLEKHKVDAKEFQAKFGIGMIKELKQKDLGKAKAWISKQGQTATTARATDNSIIAPAAAKRLREGMAAVGISDETYKKEIGALPEETKKVDFARAEAFINKIADGGAN